MAPTNRELYCRSIAKTAVFAYNGGKEMMAMYEINNQKFGVFLRQLRMEHDMTQKDLAEKLFVSDKAVSKWERG